RTVRLPLSIVVDDSPDARRHWFATSDLWTTRTLRSPRRIARCVEMRPDDDTNGLSQVSAMRTSSGLLRITATDVGSSRVPNVFPVIAKCFGVDHDDPCHHSTANDFELVVLAVTRTTPLLIRQPVGTRRMS